MSFGKMEEVAIKVMFDDLDKDGDGKLTLDELRPMVQTDGEDDDDMGLKVFFAACDTNGDQRVSFEEFKAFLTDQSEDSSDDEELMGNKHKNKEVTKPMGQGQGCQLPWWKDGPHPKSKVQQWAQEVLPVPDLNGDDFEVAQGKVTVSLSAEGKDIFVVEQTQRTTYTRKPKVKNSASDGSQTEA